MADHTALALYFHARPQAAPFSPTAFAKDRISGDTKFGAAVQLAGFEFMRSLSDAAGDPATLLRQAEVLARAVDMRRLPTGGVSHKARTSTAMYVETAIGGSQMPSPPLLAARCADRPMLRPRS